MLFISISYIFSSIYCGNGKSRSNDSDINCDTNPNTNKKRNRNRSFPTSSTFLKRFLNTDYYNKEEDNLETNTHCCKKEIIVEKKSNKFISNPNIPLSNRLESLNKNIIDTQSILKRTKKSLNLQLIDEDINKEPIESTIKEKVLFFNDSSEEEDN